MVGPAYFSSLALSTRIGYVAMIVRKGLRGKSMPDVELNFSREEYATRLTKVRQSMENHGLDVVITRTRPTCRG